MHESGWQEWVPAPPPDPLENNLFVGNFSPSCRWALFLPFGGLCFSFWVPFSLCGGGSPDVQKFFGAHALVATVIASMLIWSNLRQTAIHNQLISVNIFWSTFRIL